MSYSKNSDWKRVAADIHGDLAVMAAGCGLDVRETQARFRTLLARSGGVSSTTELPADRLRALADHHLYTAHELGLSLLLGLGDRKARRRPETSISCGPWKPSTLPEAEPRRPFKPLKKKEATPAAAPAPAPAPAARQPGESDQDHRVRRRSSKRRRDRGLREIHVATLKRRLARRGVSGEQVDDAVARLFPRVPKVIGEADLGALLEELGVERRQGSSRPVVTRRAKLPAAPEKVIDFNDWRTRYERDRLASEQGVG